MGASVNKIDKLDLASLRPKQVPPRPDTESHSPVITAVSEPVAHSAVVQSPRRDWTKFGLICVVVCLGVYIAMSRGVIPTPSPSPDIDVDGFHVMLIQPDSDSGLTTGQKEFLRSAKVADWVTENGGEFRAYPQSQNLDNESEVWKSIRSELSPPMVVGVLNDRKLTRMEAPNGIDEGIRALEKLK